MKRRLIFLFIVFCSAKIWAQESDIIISGGYVFANLQNADQNATGFRINGLYEFNPTERNFAHGVSFGYLRTTGTRIEDVSSSKYIISNFPIYYAPKLMFGSKSFKGFLKGALGFHCSQYKLSGDNTSSDGLDFGFYAGAGAGLMTILNDKIIINVEYEWAYLTNSSYRSGLINTVMGGVGFKF
jgi:hypothetical protein